MIQALKDSTKSIKTGDWDLHIFTSEKMVHWLHAYDYFNYAMVNTAISTQQVLPVKHTDVDQNFKNGYFSNHHSEGKFNKVSPDQIIEKRIGKDRKGPGAMHL